MPSWTRSLLTIICLLPLPVVSEDTFQPDPKWNVARAQFTTQIDNREPVDEVAMVGPPVAEVYFFTDLRHLQGRTVTHRWEYEGQLISLVPFTVDGPRWRVFSKKEIKPEQIGEWSVTVLDESGWPLRTEIFHYQPTTTAIGSPSNAPAADAAPGGEDSQAVQPPAGTPISE